MRIYDAAQKLNARTVFLATVPAPSLEYAFTLLCVRTSASVEAFVCDTKGRISGARCKNTHPAPGPAALLEAFKSHPARETTGMARAYAAIKQHFAALEHGEHDAGFTFDARVAALLNAGIGAYRVI